MSKCLFTYERLEKGIYSPQGLKKLNTRLTNLNLFPYDQKEQLKEVQKHAGKISIQGIQPKLSAKLSVKNENFVLVEKNGEFIIKPQVFNYQELPENEDLTMHLAQIAGLNVPWHGLIKAKDKSLLYVIKRFDRMPLNKKLHQEDFAQLMGATRSTKYLGSMEKVCEIVEEYASFPTLELEILFKLTLFSFLIGNEDLHLKNFSMQTTLKGVTKLTPVYDLVNSTIALSNPQEELALEMNGKKSGFKKKDFIDYFASEYCYVSKDRAQKTLDDLLAKVTIFDKLIKKSLLSKEMQNKYQKVLHERANILKS